MTEYKGRHTTPSDRPPDDLKKERDAYIQQFFRKGAQFTEELLKENERLRERVGELETENRRLRAHLASDEAIRDLLRKIEDLESEKMELMHRSVRAEAVKENYGAQYSEVESELAHFANLYVATTQLHAARSVRGVLRALKEMLAQLLGAAAFAVYFASDDGSELIAITSEGVESAEVARHPMGKGAIGRAFATGEVIFAAGQSPFAPGIALPDLAAALPASRDLTKASIDDPAAVIPLQIDGRV